MRKQISLLLLVLAGAAAGYAMGYAARREQEPASPPSRTPAEQTVAVARLSMQEPAPTLVPAVEPSKSTTQPANELASNPTSDATSGPGRFDGLVITERGEPLAGVLIRARVDGDLAYPTVPQPDEVSQEDFLRAMASRYEETRRTYREARTGSDGRFLMEGLPLRWYRLSGVLDGHEIVNTYNSDRFKPPHTVHFVARRAARVPVTVCFEDGRPATRATIACSIKNTINRIRWESGDPTILLHPGSYTLTASFDADAKSAPANVTVPDDLEGIPAVTLTLKPRTGIRGFVVCPPAEILTGAHVLYHRISADDRNSGATDEETLLASTYEDSVTGSPGWFDILDLAPGTYLVGAGRLRGRIDVMTTIEVTHGIEEIELSLPPIDPNETVIAWLRDAANHPLSQEDVRPYLLFPDEEPGQQHYIAGIDRPDGSIVVFLDEQTLKALPAGNVVLEGFYEGMRRSARLTAAATEVTIQFEEPAQLEVTIVGYSESRDGDGFKVTVSDGKWECVEGVDLDEQGVVSFDAIDPGRRYDVCLCYGAGSLACTEVMMRPGTNKAAIQVPPLYSFAVIAPDPTFDGVEMMLTLARADERPCDRWSEFDATGRAEFSNVLAGEYRILSDSERIQGQMRIRVPCPPEILFVERPYDAYAVSIPPAQRDSYWATLGVTDGDLIIGFDGIEFETLEQVRPMLGGIYSKANAHLLVQRGAARLEIPFVPAELWKTFEDGYNACLTPTTRE